MNAGPPVARVGKAFIEGISAAERLRGPGLARTDRRRARFGHRHRRSSGDAKAEDLPYDSLDNSSIPPTSKSSTNAEMADCCSRAPSSSCAGCRRYACRPANRRTGIRDVGFGIRSARIPREQKLQTLPGAHMAKIARSQSKVLSSRGFGDGSDRASPTGMDGCQRVIRSCRGQG